jgi:hypothetical protein
MFLRDGSFVLGISVVVVAGLAQSPDRYTSSTMWPACWPPGEGPGAAARLYGCPQLCAAPMSLDFIAAPLQNGGGAVPASPPELEKYTLLAVATANTLYMQCLRPMRKCRLSRADRLIMAISVRVAERGSVVGAVVDAGLSPSAVAKLIRLRGLPGRAPHQRDNEMSAATDRAKSPFAAGILTCALLLTYASSRPIGTVASSSDSDRQ